MSAEFNVGQIQDELSITGAQELGSHRLVTSVSAMPVIGAPSPTITMRALVGLTATGPSETAVQQASLQMQANFAAGKNNEGQVLRLNQQALTHLFNLVNLADQTLQ